MWLWVFLSILLIVIVIWIILAIVNKAKKAVGLVSRTWPCKPVSVERVFSLVEDKFSVTWSTVVGLIIDELNKEIASLDGTSLGKVGTLTFCGDAPYISDADITPDTAYIYPNGCTVDATTFDQWPLVCSAQNVVTDCGSAPPGMAILAAQVDLMVLYVPCVELSGAQLQCSKVTLAGQVFMAVDCNSTSGSSVTVKFIGFAATSVQPVECYTPGSSCDWNTTSTSNVNCSILSSILGQVVPSNPEFTIYEEFILAVSQALSGTSFTLPLASVVKTLNLCGSHSETSGENDVPGCTDPRASNYNVKANVYDGSCVYDASGDVVQACISSALCGGMFPCDATDVFVLIEANMDGGITAKIKSALNIEFCGQDVLTDDPLLLCGDDDPLMTTTVFIPLYLISGVESAPCVATAAADAVVALSEYEAWYADEVIQCAADEASACAKCAEELFDPSKGGCKKCYDPTHHITSCECSKANRADPCQQTASCSTLAQSACASTAWSNAEDCYDQDGCTVTFTSNKITGMSSLADTGVPNFCYSCESATDAGLGYVDMSVQDFGVKTGTVKMYLDAKGSCLGSSMAGTIVAEISDFKIMIDNLVLRFTCTGDGDRLTVTRSPAYSVSLSVSLGSIGFACSDNDFLCQNMNSFTADILNAIYAMFNQLQNDLDLKVTEALDSALGFDVRPPQGVIGNVISCSNPDNFICGSDSVWVGCTDSSAANYNPMANVTDDTECTYYGCTDSSANNFDADASVDDGSCTYDTGCTDPAATNYVISATKDDGSCIYDYGSTMLCGEVETVVSGTTYTGCGVFSEPSSTAAAACETLYNNMVNIQATTGQDEDTTDEQALATMGRSIKVAPTSGTSCTAYYADTSSCWDGGSKFFDSQADFEAVYTPVDIKAFTVN